MVDITIMIFVVDFMNNSAGIGNSLYIGVHQKAIWLSDIRLAWISIMLRMSYSIVFNDKLQMDDFTHLSTPLCMCWP